MEEFIRTVKSQVVPLASTDIQSCQSHIPIVSIYGNEGSNEHFMPPELLRDAFYTALQEFPLFAGRFTNEGNGCASMVVEKDSLNMPEYLETASSIHYSHVKDAEFSWDTWPRELTTALPANRADVLGDTANVKVHIVRLRDNSGLFLFMNISHFLVDAFGYFVFLNRWAELCKAMRDGAIGDSTQSVTFSHDRALIEQALPAERKPLTPTLAKIIQTRSMLASWLHWLSPTTRASLLNKLPALIGIEPHVFFISNESLDNLCKGVSEFLPKGMRISRNDILTALLSMTYVQSEASVQPKSIISRIVKSALGFLYDTLVGKSADHVTVFPCDIRRRIGIADKNLTGNAIVLVHVVSKIRSLLASITVESLANIVLDVRQGVNEVDAAYTNTYMSTVAPDQSYRSKLVAYSFGHSILGLSNLSRLNTYGADFGDGGQAWAIKAQETNSPFVSVFPSPLGDGVHIHVTTKRSTMERILKHDFWMNVARLVF